MSFHDSCKRLDGEIDGSLSTYITKTKAIEALEDLGSPAVVVVGLKGIGKSSAFRYLTEFGTDRPDVVIGINADRFSLHLTNRDLSYSTCRKQFEHDIVIEALRGITDHQPEFSTPKLKPLITEARSELKSYLDVAKQFTKRGGGISILGFGFTVGKKDVPVLVGLTPEARVKSSLNTLRAICGCGVKLRIVVDDPEQVFSSSRTLDTHLVGGFCLAAIHLSEAIPNLKVIALLKTHVYQPVLRDVDDLTKYPDHMVRLRWTEEELLKVIYRRLDAAGEKWQDVFRDTSAVIKGEFASISRNGPRDLLHALDVALKNSNSGKLGKSDLEGSREAASQDSLVELGSAYSSQYPDFADVLRVVFRDSPTQSFTIKQLRKHIENLIVSNHDMIALSKLKWMQSRSSQTIPELLFETGTLALESGGKLTLPYEEGYSLDQFRKAQGVRLVPALVSAVANY